MASSAVAEEHARYLAQAMVALASARARADQQHHAEAIGPAAAKVAQNVRQQQRGDQDGKRDAGRYHADFLAGSQDVVSLQRDHGGIQRAGQQFDGEYRREGERPRPARQRRRQCVGFGRHGSAEQAARIMTREQGRAMRRAYGLSASAVVRKYHPCPRPRNRRLRSTRCWPAQA